MLLASILAVCLGRSIGKPLKEIAGIAEKVAVGDLTAHVELTKRGDEVELYTVLPSLIDISGDFPELLRV